MRVLALLTDAFGGRGGIAKFNRDLLRALCSYPATREVVAVPRVVVEPVGDLPAKLTFVSEAAGGKVGFVRSTLGILTRDADFDLVICGHIYLLPVAVAAARRADAPLLLVSHGIEVWEPPSFGPRAWLLRRLASQITAVVTVSQVTRDRMASWLDLDDARSFVIPNCIDVAPFGTGPRSDELLDRYDLRDSTILLTVARLSAGERYKGMDEVIDLLPTLQQDISNVKYLICGDGDDRDRLEAKAAQLGLADRVVFAGYIPEAEKADHYRLADAFVMPGRGEGFGIVYLEALACGVPVVASSSDASREAVLDGELGEVVDPSDPADIRRGIHLALDRPRTIPERLDHFSSERFRQRWHAVLDALRGTAADVRTLTDSEPASV